MPMQQLLLERNEVKTYYEDLTKGMQKAIQVSKTSNEEKLKIETLVEFDKFFSKFGITLRDVFDYEMTSIGGVKLKGRTDVLSGSLIIEFKTYNNLDKVSEYKKAIKQVQEKYLNPIIVVASACFYLVVLQFKPSQ